MPAASERQLKPVVKADREAPTLTATAATGLSVIVPMFNERECVDLIVSALERVEQDLGEQYPLEFLLIDDGSTDDTVALLEQAIGERPHFVILRHIGNKGIAAAIHTGLKSASYGVAASVDCDGSYDLCELGPMVRLLTDGVDLVTASPYHPAGQVDNVPEWRLKLSRLASQLYGLAMRRNLTCYTSCYRVYRRDAVVGIALANLGFVGVAELLCRLVQSGGQVVEHPARLQARVAGHSKMRVLRASLGHFRLLCRLALTRSSR